MGRGVSSSSKSIALLPQTTIAAAVTGTVGSVFSIRGSKYLLIEGTFNYGAGGTTAKFWIQTRVAGGTWRDIANFAFTISSSTNWHAVHAYTALAANIAVSDAALVDNTILNGFLGDELRVKYTTTGIYSGATNMTITVTARE